MNFFFLETYSLNKVCLLYKVQDASSMHMRGVLMLSFSQLHLQTTEIFVSLGSRSAYLVMEFILWNFVSLLILLTFTCLSST